jgi:hypothetical protein
VAPVGGQQLHQHAPAQPQQPRADNLLGGSEGGVAAAQEPGRLAGQAA